MTTSFKMALYQIPKERELIFHMDRLRNTLNKGFPSAPYGVSSGGIIKAALCDQGCEVSVAESWEHFIETLEASVHHVAILPFFSNQKGVPNDPQIPLLYQQMLELKEQTGVRFIAVDMNSRHKTEQDYRDTPYSMGSDLFYLQGFVSSVCQQASLSQVEMERRELEKETSRGHRVIRAPSL